MTPKETRSPNLLQALIPIVVLITLLVLNVTHFGDHTLDGANQFALILASAVAGIIAIFLGVKWTHIQESMVKSIGSAMPSILILLMIGALAGTWLLSGVVPTLIYYGLLVRVIILDGILNRDDVHLVPLQVEADFTLLG